MSNTELIAEARSYIETLLVMMQDQAVEYINCLCNSLEAAQAEIDRLNRGWESANTLMLERSLGVSNLHHALVNCQKERDATLARLAEIEKRDVSAWLIEYNFPHCPPQWAMLRRSNCIDYTMDANNATRFSRREDAQNVLDQLTGLDKLTVLPENVPEYFRVTEHMFIAAAGASPQPSQVRELSDEEIAKLAQKYEYTWGVTERGFRVVKFARALIAAINAKEPS